MSKPKTVLLFFAVLGCLFLIVFLPSAFPQVQSDVQRQNNVAENTQLIATVTLPQIFLTNLLVAAFTVFPVSGWLFLVAVLWRSGLVLASYSNPGFLVYIFMTIELSVYSYCVLQSIKIAGCIKHGQYRVIPKTVAITIGVAALILFLSAFTEYFLVKLV